MIMRCDELTTACAEFFAVEHGWARVEWNVLDWNDPALGFYRRLGAERLEDWTVHRLSGASLDVLATSGHAGNDRSDDSGK